jgi:hypothetical protein
MDAKALYISNYMTEITVPLTNVAEVTGSRWSNTHDVTIRFHTQTEFGPKIVFIPKSQLFLIGRPHPVVAEIRSAVARANGHATPV